MKVNICLLLFCLLGLFIQRSVLLKEKCKKEQEKVEEKCPPENNEYETVEMIPCFPKLNPIEDTNQENLTENSQEKLSSSDSVCLNCTVCIAVAQKLGADISKLIESQKSTKEEGSLCTDNFVLVDICSTGFERYVYQEQNGKRSIGPLKTGSTLVDTPDVKSWTELLEDTCQTLVSFYGEQNAFEEWKENQNLETALCKGRGVFGACNFMSDNNTEINDIDDDGYDETCGKYNIILPSD